MTPTAVIVLLGLLAGLYGLGRWARRHPHDGWAQALWDLAVGPRTDVSLMTRRELFESAGSFVTWTLLAILVLELVWLFLTVADSPWAETLTIVVAIVVVSGGGAAAYMLTCALLRRRTYLSHERFSAELAVMQFWICRGDWSGLEAYFHAFAERTCGQHTALSAAAVDLDEYRERLGCGLHEALVAAADAAAVIVYLHRPDQAWSGAFCVYRSAAAVAAAPPRRMDACIAEVPGPACAPLAELFLDHGDALNAVALFLVARTVAALGRCTDHVALGRSALCMAFEDDASLVWLREPSTDV